MPSSDQAALAERLVVALAPSPSVRELAQRRVVEFAEQLADDALLGDVVTAAENPQPVRSVDLARRAGVSYRQINYWTSEGWLSTTSPEEQPGPGHPVEYPPEAITKARVMGSLVRMFSMSPRRASSLADEIVRNGRAQVEGYTITRDGRS